MAKVQGEKQQHAANYGTPDNPALIRTPDHNGPRPTTPRANQDVPTFVRNDQRSLQERLVDQQWRDAKALGLFGHSPASLNSGDAPEQAEPSGSLADNGDGSWTITDPGLVGLGDGAYRLTSPHLTSVGNGTHRYEA